MTRAVQIAQTLGWWERRDLATLVRTGWIQDSCRALRSQKLARARRDAYRDTHLEVCDLTPLGRDVAAILALTGRLPDPE